MIAMALVCDPELLIADEPTTALDVTVQAQIMDLLKDLQQEFGTSIVFITHDLGVISRMADDILVMYAGRAVERGTRDEVLRTPEHPYTWGLLGAMPTLRAPVESPSPRSPAHPRHSSTPSRAAASNHAAPSRNRPRTGHCATRRPTLPRTAAHGAACHLTRAQRGQFYLDYVGADTR